MTREEQINDYINTSIEQYAESVDCHPKEVEHFGHFIRIGVNWADRNPKDEVNWQQVRIQAAIAAMQGLLSNEKQVHIKVSEAAYISVLYADALIEGLKGE